MSRMAVASARAVLSAGPGLDIDLVVGPHRLVTEGSVRPAAQATPTPAGWLAAALASDATTRARACLELRGGTVGDVEVFVEYDMGPPTVWRRLVYLDCDPASGALEDVAAAVERGGIERGGIEELLRHDLSIRTRVIARSDAERPREPYGIR